VVSPFSLVPLVRGVASVFTVRPPVEMNAVDLGVAVATSSSTEGACAVAAGDGPDDGELLGSGGVLGWPCCATDAGAGLMLVVVVDEDLFCSRVVVVVAVGTTEESFLVWKSLCVVVVVVVVVLMVCRCRCTDVVVENRRLWMNLYITVVGEETATRLPGRGWI